MKDPWLSVNSYIMLECKATHTISAASSTVNLVNDDEIWLRTTNLCATFDGRSYSTVDNVPGPIVACVRLEDRVSGVLRNDMRESSLSKPRWTREQQELGGTSIGTPYWCIL